MGFIVGTIVLMLAAVIGEAVRRNTALTKTPDKRFRPAVLHGPILALWLVLFALTSFTQVGTGEIAVMTRFGRVTGQELDEGIHFKIPTDKANIYDVKVQKEEAQAAAASLDLQDVNSDLALNFALERGRVDDIHGQVGSAYKEKLIDPTLQEAFKATTAQYTVSDLIAKRPEVKQRAVTALRDRLEPYGIRIVDLNITNLAFSKSFTDAIERKQVAQQEAERAQFNLQAARVDAEAQSVQGATLTGLYLQKLFLEKWNGVMPQVVSGPGGPQTIIDLMTTGQR